MLVHSWLVGAATLIGYAYLVGRTGFTTPFHGIVLASLCYAGGIAALLWR